MKCNKLLINEQRFMLKGHRIFGDEFSAYKIRRGIKCRCLIDLKCVSWLFEISFIIFKIIEGAMGKQIIQRWPEMPHIAPGYYGIIRLEAGLPQKGFVFY